MANISTFLQKILSAIYGEEVRGAIHDALAAMNTESNAAMEYAKTAKDSAAASASMASVKATAASVSAQAAKTSENNAKISENNAKTSETNAVNKAAEATAAAAGAKASETVATNSASAATQKAGEAADSQVAAALSESEAKAAEERTKAIKMDVQTLASQVEADKIAADASRAAAEDARDAASTSEINAQNSANTALNAEAEAKVSKDDAETAAKAAVESEANAKTSLKGAEEAKVAAEAARDAAADSADDASASALSAQQYSGKPPMPKDGTWWIWDADEQDYIDTTIGCELVGPIGIGIENIVLTDGDHSPGTTDIYTVTMTNGTSYPISVYNGRNGTGTGDVLGIWFDLIIPASGWNNGEITIADERLLALSTHKYFISASQASREEFLECNVQPKDITTSGFITFTNEADPTEDLIVNVIRFELSANRSA